MINVAQIQRVRRELPLNGIARVVIVCGVLMASAYLGQRNSQTQLFQLVAAIVAIAGVVILSRQPALGLVAVMVAAISLPFDFGTGTQTSVPVAMVLVAGLTGLWVFKMLERRRFTWIPSSANTPLVWFLVSATISLIAGNLAWNYYAKTAPLTAQIGGWAIFFFSGMLFLLAANQIQDESWLKLLVGIMIVAGLISYIDRVVPALSPLTSRLIFQRQVDYWTQTGLASQSLYWLWAVVMAAGQAVGNRELKPPVRVVLLGLALAILGQAWILARDWTSGWLPLVVGLLVILYMRTGWRGVVLSAVAAVLILSANPDLIATRFDKKSYSIDTRAEAKDIMLDSVIPLSPVLGLGPANYYFYTPLFPIRGYYVRFNSHNQYIDILAQTGIVGLVMFGWFFLAVGFILWRMRNRSGRGFANGYVLGCIAGLIGTLVAGGLADWIIPFTYNIGMLGFRASLLPWLFLGGAVALEHRLQTKGEVV